MRKRDQAAGELDQIRVGDPGISEANDRKLPQSRSLSTIKSDLLPVVKKAGEIIVRRTLLENPFASASEHSDWISSARIDTFGELKRAFEDCNRLCRREVSKAPCILTADGLDWRLANPFPNGSNNVRNSYGAATGGKNRSIFTNASRTLNSSLKLTAKTQRRSRIESNGCSRKTHLCAATTR